MLKKYLPFLIPYAPAGLLLASFLIQSTSVVFIVWVIHIHWMKWILIEVHFPFSDTPVVEMVINGHHSSVFTVQSWLYKA